MSFKYGVSDIHDIILSNKERAAKSIQTTVVAYEVEFSVGRKAQQIQNLGKSCDDILQMSAQFSSNAACGSFKIE